MAAPRALVPCLDGLTETVRQMRDHFGVQVVWHQLEHDIGIWQPTTRTIYVNVDSPIADQTWLLVDLWKLLMIGPQSAPDAQLMRPPTERSLRLVIRN